MVKYFIFISVDDNDGGTWSKVYASDTYVNDELIDACKKNFESLYSVSNLYFEIGSIIVIPASNAKVEGNLINAQECLDTYRSILKREEEV